MRYLSKGSGSNKNSAIDNDIKVDMVSSDQMSEEDRRAIFDREASVDAIPDLDVLTGHVFDILNYLDKPDVKKLMKTNESAVKVHLNNKYADSVPLGIITLLMEEDNKVENIERMLTLFESLRRAKSGEISLEDAEKRLIDDVNERYLYSKYGSKEAFEKELMKEIRNERRGKNAKNAEALRDTGRVRIKV